MANKSSGTKSQIITTNFFMVQKNIQIYLVLKLLLEIMINNQNVVVFGAMEFRHVLIDPGSISALAYPHRLNK